MKKLSNLIYFLLTFLFFTYLNFYFSNLIAYKALHGWEFSGPLFKIVYTENTGAAFSIMNNSTGFLMVVSLVAILAILYYVIKYSGKVNMKLIFFISLLMAGICGNLCERFFLGYVRDFFDLTFIHFPIFNVSDIFINIGVVGIIIFILLSKKN